MSGSTYIKIKPAPAVQLCALVTLSDGARALLQPDMAPAPFFEALQEKALLPDAIRFLSAALPAREAVWWACVCTRETLGDGTAAPLLDAVQAAENWVFRPDEENRRAARVAADATKLQAAAGWAAMAAFWSGGSITAPNAPTVEPDRKMLPSAISGAVLLAAVQSEPHRVAERHRQFLAAGCDIASGGNGRPQAKAG